jgi:hypothetical protein
MSRDDPRSSRLIHRVCRSIQRLSLQPLGVAGVVCFAGALAAACGDPEDDEPAGDEVVFSADYASDYTEVRDCRQSGDHDLNNIRIVADSAALAPYQDRSTPFPTGSIVLKEEFEFDDVDCTGEVKQWTVMQKLESGSGADTLGWTWQQVDRERGLVSENSQRCVACHSGCAGSDTGYDATCADP